MATDLREELRRLVDEVPEGDLVAALRYLEYLAAAGEHPAIRALLSAPVEEPKPDEIGMLDDYDRRLAAGECEWVSHEEVKRRARGDGT